MQHIPCQPPHFSKNFGLDFCQAGGRGLISFSPNKRIAFGAPQQDDESNEDFAKRQQDEANASITQFGRNLQIRNPFFYARYGAENPFAVQTAAQGGIMGYRTGYEKAGMVNN